jgi:hypothetical protein
MRALLRGAAMLLLAACLIWDASSTPRAASPRFLPDDPLWHDDDTVMDAGSARPQDLSQQFDFLENTFAMPGDRRDVRAMNVNTVDEVPDSMWFVNRMGHRPLTDAEVRRGPDTLDTLDLGEWVIVAGKNTGLQPGFRAIRRHDVTQQLYQLEFDPPGLPDLATGAEMVGTTLYHALGYHVVENYLVTIDPDVLAIDPAATARDRAGRRVPFTRADLDAVLARAHRNDDGTYRALASRFATGKPMGNFRYHGTRVADPNDIHPHEHRRELRGNRVFSAWLNHDDSRAVNTLDMLEGQPGRQYIRHYMFDFGSIMGSGTTGHDTARSGNAYLLDRPSSVRTLLSLGLWAPDWVRRSRPAFSPSAGPFTADTPFDPAAWRAEYPNTAFDNMRLDDAFWAARRVAAFSDTQLQVVVEKAQYRDPRAHTQIVQALAARRDVIARTWLTAITPIVQPDLGADGRLTFRNAAVEVGVASAPDHYDVTWSRFDNASQAHTEIGPAMRWTAPAGDAPDAVRRATGYVAVRIHAEHPEHPDWRLPVTAYFHREDGRWRTVGLDRALPEPSLIDRRPR